MDKAALVLELLISFTERARQLAHLLQVAKEAGRDVTDDEIATLANDDDIAKAALDAAIIKAGGKPSVSVPVEQPPQQ